MVTSRIMSLTGKTLVLLNRTSGVSKGRSYSLSIVVC